MDTVMEAKQADFLLAPKTQEWNKKIKSIVQLCFLIIQVFIKTKVIWSFRL